MKPWFKFFPYLPEKHRPLIIVWTIILSLSILFLPCRGFAYSLKKWGPAARIVNEFCHKDGMGKRLSSDSYSIFKRLTLWDDEPGWDTIVMIKSFKISEEVYDHDTAKVKVIYEVIAKQNSEGIFIPQHEQEIELYKLQLHRGKWKIKAPQLMPHVFEIGLKTPK